MFNCEVKEKINIGSISLGVFMVEDLDGWFSVYLDKIKLSDTPTFTK